MKAIIDGKKYNTETARRLGFWCSENGWRDFSHVEETLYRKKTGEYFIFGEGGPMSKYRKNAGTNIFSSSKFIPVTEAEAKKWAEKHLTADEYEEIFGEVEE